MTTSGTPDSRGVEMNVSGTTERSDGNWRPARRVREDVRDGLGVVVFSAVASATLAVAMALVLTAFTRLAG
jgi:hypothetical protein